MIKPNTLRFASAFAMRAMLRRTGAWLLAGFAALTLAHAQTLQFNFPFDDAGTSTTSSGAAGAITLNTVNNSSVAVDLHGGVGSGLGGGQALDFGKVCFAQNGTPSGLAFITNSANLGLGNVSNCTVVLWFNFAGNNINNPPRFFILGTNGITDGAGAGQSSIGFQLQSSSQLQFGMGQNGATAGFNVTFEPRVNGQIPISQWEFVALVYDTAISNGVFSVYTGDINTAPMQVATNILVNKGPLTLGTAGYAAAGQSPELPARFLGKMANLQFYTGAASSSFVSNVWAQIAPANVIKLSSATGADVGSNAVLNVSVPNGVTALAPLTIALSSSNTAVVASTSITLPIGVTSSNVNLPILSVGNALVVATGAGVGTASTKIAGLNQSGLVNRWVGDDFVPGSSWVDRVSSVAAVLNGNSTATLIAGAFGSHAGVAETNNANTVTGNGFIIPAGTAFGAGAVVTNFTVAIAFKPTAAGPIQGGYYNNANIMGYDIGGAGQPDWGIAWGGNDGTQGGLEIDGGVGRVGGDSRTVQLAGNPTALNVTHAAVMQVNNADGTHRLWIDGVQVAVNGGLSFFAMGTNNNINLLSPIYPFAPYGVFPGSLAEIRFYTNALVDGAGLSANLKNTYAGLLPIVLAAQPVAADPGSAGAVLVTIPTASSQTGPFTVTLSSDNAAVVANRTVTLPQGTTSTNVSFTVLGIGKATGVAEDEDVSDAHCELIEPRIVAEELMNHPLLKVITDQLEDSTCIVHSNGPGKTLRQ
ncbi:MAG: hypothetical protein QM813_10725 [Verrucomicrobiota bacterium]